MTFVAVAPLSDVPEGELLEVEVGGVRVCLANCEGEVYAFANNCTHRDFPLSAGELDCDDCSITCDWHGARFDIRSGKALSLPATRPVAVYACKVEDGSILVDVTG
ncbi:MAG TPA: non-heme iron oxygenase ferredoxin subunit [Longimicrobiaceae bacterium]|nr:non-heme iron oxygenase ferredoxin subunit [Longimicrobiaceae bacterium]